MSPGPSNKTSFDFMSTGDEHIMVRVGSEVITAKELALSPEIKAKLAKSKTAASSEKNESMGGKIIKMGIQAAIRKKLQAAIQAKLILLDAKQKIPAEGMTQIEKKLEDMFRIGRTARLFEYARVWLSPRNSTRNSKSAEAAFCRRRRRFAKRC